MDSETKKESDTGAQMLFSLGLVLAGTVAVAILSYGLTGVGENSVPLSVGGLLGYLIVWGIALWWASRSSGAVKV
jgi:hypothetical protein